MVSPIGAGLDVGLIGRVDFEGCVEVAFLQEVFHRIAEAEDEVVDLATLEIHAPIVERFGECLDDFGAVELLHLAV